MVSFIVVTLLFVLIYGEDLYIAIHDNLDASMPYYKILRDQGLFWESQAEIPILHGLDRNYFPSELKLYSILYMLFPPFAAYIVGWYIRIFLSVSGFLFLVKILWQEDDNRSSTLTKNLAAVCGLLYGIFPSFPVQSTSFASIPWLFALLVLLDRERKWYYFFLIFLYPFFSDFALFGFFICGYMVLFFVIDWIKNRRPRLCILGALVTLACGYIVTEWRLFYVTLFSGTLSVRESYVFSALPLSEVPKTIWTGFAGGTFHADSLHTWIVLPTCLICCAVTLFSYIRKREVDRIWKDPLNWILLWIFGNSLIYALNETALFRNFVSSLIPPLSSFQFDRTLWFNPFLWYLAFLLSLLRIRKEWLRNLLWIAAFLVVCAVPRIYSPIVYNVPFVYEAYVKLTGKEAHLSYREFFSEELFSEIKEKIDYQGEWAVAFGMHPSVLQYNGIATLDGYASFYPLEYKMQFRELIAPELAVDEQSRVYYDDWGARAYVFSDRISYEPKRTLEQNDAEMRIDKDAFQRLRGRYIFSRVAVTNAEELGIQMIGKYKKEGLPYTIYVYETER